MKKTILSILVVLLLSFVLAGCDEELVDPADLDKDAIKAVEDFGLDPDDILVPAGTTFHGHYRHASAGLFLTWGDADQEKYNAYKASFARALVSTAEDAVTVKGASSAKIYFYATAGSEDGIEVPANSIVLNVKR